MNHHVTWTEESERAPIGKAWKAYWKARQENTSEKAKKMLRAEKREARKKMHRKHRAAVRREIKEHLREANRRT